MKLRMNLETVLICRRLRTAIVSSMVVTKIPADVLFRVFTACQGDPTTLILDVRPHKDFKKKHIAGAYCVRLAANGHALLDYSKNSYNLSWSKDCWYAARVLRGVNFA